MRAHRNWSAIRFTAALSQVSDQFFTGIELCLRRLTAVEVADQTDSERDVVQKIAVNMTTIDLTPPPIAYFHLSVAR